MVKSGANSWTFFKYRFQNTYAKVSEQSLKYETMEAVYEKNNVI